MCGKWPAGAHLALNVFDAGSVLQHEVVEDVDGARYGRTMKYSMVKLSVGREIWCECVAGTLHCYM